MDPNIRKKLCETIFTPEEEERLRKQFKEEAWQQVREALQKRVKNAIREAVRQIVHQEREIGYIAPPPPRTWSKFFYEGATSTFTSINNFTYTYMPIRIARTLVTSIGAGITMGHIINNVSDMTGINPFVLLTAGAMLKCYSAYRCQHRNHSLLTPRDLEILAEQREKRDNTWAETLLDETNADILQGLLKNIFTSEEKEKLFTQFLQEERQRMILDLSEAELQQLRGEAYRRVCEVRESSKLNNFDYTYTYEPRIKIRDFIASVAAGVITGRIAVSIAAATGINPLVGAVGGAMLTCYGIHKYKQNHLPLAPENTETPTRRPSI